MKKLLIILPFLLISCTMHSPPTMPRIDMDNYNRILFIQSIIHIESKGNPFAVGSTNDAGILQITPICVKEANRILKRKEYTLDDRFSHKKSVEIFNIIQSHHNPTFNYRKACKIWNPGAGKSYTEKILKEYAKRRSMALSLRSSRHATHLQKIVQ